MPLRTPKTPDFHDERVTLAFTHFKVSEIIGGYKARYPDSYEATLQYEGGYVNDPDDPGGCTNMGITIGTLRDWRNDQSVNCDDVKNLSPTEAALIYALNYWSPVWGNQVPIGVNTQVWDFGVNAGPSRAIKYLQMCVGTTQDGIMGPNTLQAVRDADVDRLLVQYHDARQGYYESLSTFSKYGNGWTARNDDCLALAQRLHAEGPNPLPDINLPDGGGGSAAAIAALDARVAKIEAWAGSFNAG